MTYQANHTAMKTRRGTVRPEARSATNTPMSPSFHVESAGNGCSTVQLYTGTGIWLSQSVSLFVCGVQAGLSPTSLKFARNGGRR
jgi:hypothetical protein